MFYDYDEEYEVEGESRTELNKQYLRQFCDKHDGELDDKVYGLACEFNGPDGYHEQVTVAERLTGNNIEETGLTESINPGDVEVRVKHGSLRTSGHIDADEVFLYKDYSLYGGDDNAEINIR